MKVYLSRGSFKGRAEASSLHSECILEPTRTRRDMEKAVSQLEKTGLTQGLFTTIIWKVMELKSCPKKFTRASSEKEIGTVQAPSLLTPVPIVWSTRWIK